MSFWSAALITAVACLVFNFIYLRLFTDGTLQIDTSNPGKDVYKIVINDLDSLSKKKRIVIKVDTDVDLSHK